MSDIISDKTVYRTAPATPGNPYNEGNCGIMKYMCINITSISSCLTSGGVQEKEIISSFGWYYFFIKTETFMCLTFYQMC